MKRLFITEKPSVAMEFAKALGLSGKRNDGYMEDGDNVITWCVGHLVTLSYPEKYDPELTQWSLDTLPFLPKNYLYEVIPESSKQYRVVASLLNRKDVGKIYYSGDSGREGEYIQRLVRQLAGRNQSAEEYRVWIDSQTDEEILRGIREAKPLSFYDSLSESAYARAIEDYSIGINYSRAVTLKYGNMAAALSGQGKGVVSVGRVMSCVLGMVVRREREIRENIKTAYYAIGADIGIGLVCRYKPREGSPFYVMDDLYEKKGFLNPQKAQQFIESLGNSLHLKSLNSKTAKKQAPLLFNLAELQGECTKLFHISPDRTLEAAQTLYERKLTTYPRTDARVLTTAICKVIHQNISGLKSVPEMAGFAADIMERKAWIGLEKTKYVDDSAVTDHYAIIPTGKTGGLTSLGDVERKIYDLVCRRFLSIFYPAAEYEQMNAELTAKGETFTLRAERLVSPGWLEPAGKIPDTSAVASKMELLRRMNTGQDYMASFKIRKKETQPPKRYTTGSMVLAMENAGKLIDDEDLREQIRGSGIGTSATRAETIKKLISIHYIQADKNQVISPTMLGEAVFEILDLCAPMLLSPEMTASWEKGLQGIYDGKISKDTYLNKMYRYVASTVGQIKASNITDDLNTRMSRVYPYYGKKAALAAALKCPVCGRPLREGKGCYYCTGRKEGCSFTLWKKFGEKELTDGNIKDLLSGKRTAVIKGLTSQKGKKYSARLKLLNGKVVPDFE